MSEGQKLYLDIENWPLALRILVIIFGIACLFTLFFSPNHILQSLFGIYISAAFLERMWKRKDEGFITRTDDPHIFWFAMLVLGLWLALNVIILFDSLIAALS